MKCDWMTGVELLTKRIPCASEAGGRGRNGQDPPGGVLALNSCLKMVRN